MCRVREEECLLWTIFHRGCCWLQPWVESWTARSESHSIYSCLIPLCHATFKAFKFEKIYFDTLLHSTFIWHIIFHSPIIKTVSNECTYVILPLPIKIPQRLVIRVWVYLIFRWKPNDQLPKQSLNSPPQAAMFFHTDLPLLHFI